MLTFAEALGRAQPDRHKMDQQMLTFAEALGRAQPDRHKMDQQMLTFAEALGRAQPDRHKMDQQMLTFAEGRHLMRTKSSTYPFFQNVYEVVKQIPSGRVSSYGAIARYLGTAQSARTVGWALTQSHFSAEPVPAHRVVNSIGLLTGKQHFSSPTEMADLLRSEGVLIKNDHVQDFQKYFWDPSKELAEGTLHDTV